MIARIWTVVCRVAWLALASVGVELRTAQDRAAAMKLRSDLAAALIRAQKAERRVAELEAQRTVTPTPEAMRFALGLDR